MITEEQRQEARLRDRDQERIFRLEERALESDNIFVQRWCRNKIRHLMEKWWRVPA